MEMTLRDGTDARAAHPLRSTSTLAARGPGEEDGSPPRRTCGFARRQQTPVRSDAPSRLEHLDPGIRGFIETEPTAEGLGSPASHTVRIGKRITNA